MWVNSKAEANLLSRCCVCPGRRATMVKVFLQKADPANPQGTHGSDIPSPLSLSQAAARCRRRGRTGRHAGEHQLGGGHPGALPPRPRHQADHQRRLALPQQQLHHNPYYAPERPAPRSRLHSVRLTGALEKAGMYESHHDGSLWNPLWRSAGSRHVLPFVRLCKLSQGGYHLSLRCAARI